MQRFLTIGEVMLRLTPPNCNKIRTATEFEASYGGSEANIAISLANLGMDATFFTVVPDNSLGKSAVRALRANDVHCSPVIYATETDVPTHRLGTYYLEMGFGIRASKVIYDRKHSAFSEYDYSRVDLDKLLSGYDWLHLSGITPALSPSCQDLVLAALKTAKRRGMTVSFDGNFRASPYAFPMSTSSLASSHITSGRTRAITTRGTGRMAFPGSPPLKRRKRSPHTFSPAIRTSNALPDTCAMRHPAPKTASRPMSGIRERPMRADFTPLPSSIEWAAVTPLRAASSMR